MHRLIRAVETDAWAAMMPTADAFVLAYLGCAFSALGVALRCALSLVAQATVV